MSRIKEGTWHEIEAENSKGFQEYEFKDGTRVPTGTPIGKEVYRNGQWNLELYDGIFFSNIPNKYEEDKNEDN